MKFKDIRRLVKRKDGRRPSVGAIAEAAKTFTKPRGPVGRPRGFRKTSTSEDRAILKTFRKLRPPGHGVDSRRIHTALIQQKQLLIA